MKKENINSFTKKIKDNIILSAIVLFLLGQGLTMFTARVTNFFESNKSTEKMQKIILRKAATKISLAKTVSRVKKAFMFYVRLLENKKIITRGAEVYGEIENILNPLYSDLMQSIKSFKGAGIERK